MIGSARTVGAPGREARLLLAFAAAELDETRAADVRDLAAGPLDWHRLIRTAGRHRMLPLVRARLDAMGTQIPREARRRIDGAASRSAARNLALAATLVRVVDEVAGAGIPVASMKGPTLAVSLYDALDARPFADVDVAVARATAERTVRVLLDSGYRPWARPPDPASLVRWATSWPFVSPDGGAVDVHWALFGVSRPAAMAHRAALERLAVVRLCGRSVPTLRDEDLALFLAEHGSRHGWEALGWTVDFGLLVRRRPELDWAEVLAAARKLHIERVVLMAFRVLQRLLGESPPIEVIRRLAGDGRPRFGSDRLSRRLIGSLPLEGPAEAATPESAAHHPAGANAARFLRRDRRRDRLRDFVVGAVTPGPEDWEVVRLPARLAWAYRLLRPPRLALRYGRLAFEARSRVSGPGGPV